MENERVSQAGVPRPKGLTPLVLASSSPRRKEILTAVGWPFEAHPAGVDETRREGEPAEEFVRRLAREKAEAVARTRLFGLVLGADTTVLVDGEILEKPRDARDARRMLRLLGGRWHEVLTGVALVRAETGRALVGLERTRVRFAETSEEEIDWHVHTGDVLDKAGAYAIQGIGAALAAPASLSLLTTMFPEGRERTRALGLYTAVSVGGVSLGLVAGGILTEIALGKHRRDDFDYTRCLERRDILAAQPVRLAEPLFARGRRMRQHRPFSLVDRNRSKFHATAPFASRPRERKAWIVCARTATAISAGLAAPISRPIGAWIRAIWSAPAPSASKRSTRLAWVLRLPSAPT